MRHLQYPGFNRIMVGFLLQWPTLLTVVMFPTLVFMHRRLARREEAGAEQAFGAGWADYAGRTPALLPRWMKSSAAASER